MRLYNKLYKLYLYENILQRSKFFERGEVPSTVMQKSGFYVLRNQSVGIVFVWRLVVFEVVICIFCNGCNSV